MSRQAAVINRGALFVLGAVLRGKAGPGKIGKPNVSIRMHSCQKAAGIGWGVWLGLPILIHHLSL